MAVDFLLVCFHSFRHVIFYSIDDINLFFKQAFILLGQLLLEVENHLLCLALSMLLVLGMTCLDIFKRILNVRAKSCRYVIQRLSVTLHRFID